MPLTDVACRAAASREKPYKLADSGGLYLLVQPNGARYWRWKYRFAGKEKVLALGVYPAVKLAAAREARDAARALLAAGTDPAWQRKQAKREARARVENSFESLAREWHQQHAGRWTPAHAARVLWSLEKDVFPAIGPRPMAELTPPEVLDVVRAVEQREALETAGRVLQRCKAVFRYAIQTSRARQNPAAELTGVLKTRKVQHRAALSRAELPAFLAKLDTYRGDPLTRLALTLLVLTFLRPGELRAGRWDEIDTAARRWRIPAARMKMNEPHVVPLSRQALAVLEQLRPLSGRYELIFPNRNKVTRCLSENTMTYALYRLGYQSRATAHGFRSTASTILNETGFDPDVIERQLAHQERNTVRAAYHRAEYLDDRAQMMQWWADFIDQQRAIGRGENVATRRRL